MTEDFSSKTSFSREELLQCAKGELFGPNSGKLPLPPLLMFDRITEISKDKGEWHKGYAKAELDIDPSLWFFKCHFKDDPVMPGCLGLDALWQLIGFYQCWRGGKGYGRALGGDVKFSGQVLNSVKQVSYEVHVKRMIKGKISLITGSGLVFADGREIYYAKNLRVGQFQTRDL